MLDLTFGQVDAAVRKWADFAAKTLVQNQETLCAQALLTYRCPPEDLTLIQQTLSDGITIRVAYTPRGDYPWEDSGFW